MQKKESYETLARCLPGGEGALKVNDLPGAALNGILFCNLPVYQMHCKGQVWLTWIWFLGY